MATYFNMLGYLLCVSMANWEMKTGDVVEGKWCYSSFFLNGTRENYLSYIGFVPS